MKQKKADKAAAKAKAVAGKSMKVIKLSQAEGSGTSKPKSSTSTATSDSRLLPEEMHKKRLERFGKDSAKLLKLKLVSFF